MKAERGKVNKEQIGGIENKEQVGTFKHYMLMVV